MDDNHSHEDSLISPVASKEDFMISPVESREDFSPAVGQGFYIADPDYDDEDGICMPRFDDSDPPAQVVVGVCAMHKKSNSKPMQEILERLDRFEYITVMVFEEKTILEESPDKWPICDCLISFHSKGFPLDKAVKYAELRRPMMINDFHMQYRLQDRRAVHQILKEQGVEQPLFAVLDRESGNPEDCQMVESDDSIEINHVTFHKPFVEKPINAEDHNVYIYFPTSAGGGSQRLFRKIGSRSSVYSSVSTVRKNGSFIYEEFMPTDGTDVKVYTVGPEYAHAEARKSPALDGKVERDKDGKEIRYPVILTAKEKMIARKICIAFKQNVCGFDLLRANGKSYVCDVNGFSFVKTSPKYYDDCAKILGNLILRQLAPQLHIPYSITFQPEDIPIVPTTYGTMMELRCCVAVIRHGDRTPKQKMKMEVRHKKFFDLFEKYGGYKHGHLKLKKPKQLQEVLDIARFLLGEIHNHTGPEIEEKTSKLEQLKAVLEMYGHFSGINRKVQLKYQPMGAPRRSSDDDDSDYYLPRVQPVDGPREPSLVLILKWGGELTPAGKVQAEELGKAFRCMYPGGAGKARRNKHKQPALPPTSSSPPQGDFGNAPGMGLLRLHSTFRHDLKIYASDEGRVQMTAAAFAKGFLALEGELPPILAQMVKSANMNGLLDNDNESPKYQNIVKEKLQALLNIDRELTEEEVEKLAPTGSESLARAIREMGNPLQSLNKLHAMIANLLERVKELKNDPKAEELKLYHGESWELMQRRWTKLFKDFKCKNGQYDISKIPDVYDCIKYDLLHNNKILRFPEADDLHILAKSLADIVIPQEYGITKEEKLLIGQCICSPLLKKIQTDLQRNVDEETTRLDSRYSEGVSTPHRHVRTRLYFTSESHIHSLLTILRYGGFLDPTTDEQWRRAMGYVARVSELSYMTQIVIMMYEDPTKDPHSDDRFHVEIHFSPGAYYAGENKKKDPNSLGYRSQMSEKPKKEEKQEKPIKSVATVPTALDKAIEEEAISPESPSTTTTKEAKEPSPLVLKASLERAIATPTELALRKQVTMTNAVKQLEEGVSVSTIDVDVDALGVESTGSPNKSCPSILPSDESQDKINSLEPSESYGFVPSKESFTPEKNVSFAGPIAAGPSPMAEIPEKPETLSEPSASTSSQSDAIDIEAAKRKRHHSGNAVRTSEEQRRTSELVMEDKTSGSMEDSELENKLDKEARCVSMEDSLQTIPCDTPAKDGVEATLTTRTRPKRHSMGFFTNMHHYPKFNLENLRLVFQNAFSGGGKSSLISTKVINGSSSAPDLTDVDSSTSVAGGVEGWKVPSIRPLETLHNALTHKQVESFLQRITETSSRTPMSSPSRGPTPVCGTPRSSNPPPSMLGLPGGGQTSSTCSSGGPSSPTTASYPDDIMSRLRKLAAQNEKTASRQEKSTERMQSMDSSGRLERSSDSSEPPSPMVFK